MHLFRARPPSIAILRLDGAIGMGRTGLSYATLAKSIDRLAVHQDTAIPMDHVARGAVPDHPLTVDPDRHIPSSSRLDGPKGFGLT